MKILLINGSAGEQSTNKRLLNALPNLFPGFDFHYAKGLSELPLFHVDIKNERFPSVDSYLKMISESDAILVSTPEYLHNIPALLKNAFEWTTDSGVLENKPVIALTYTPHPPRGEKALQSLLNTLTALKTKTVVQLSLYHSDFFIEDDGSIKDNGGGEMIKEALSLLEV